MTVTLPISEVVVSVDSDPVKVDLRNTLERQRRMKHESYEQFHGLVDVLEGTSEDFYSARVHRSAMHEDVEVAVLGGGFGGTLAGVQQVPRKGPPAEFGAVNHRSV